jgi:hypothetical protein
LTSRRRANALCAQGVKICPVLVHCIKIMHPLRGPAHRDRRASANLLKIII